MDISKAIQKLNNDTHAVSQKDCAKYVRRAIDSASEKPLDRPASNRARDYKATLLKAGFVLLQPRPQPDYDPQAGDVVVIQNHPAWVDDTGRPREAGHEAGHIAMWNGEIWISDFRQRADSIWPGPGYRATKPSYDLYRP